MEILLVDDDILENSLDVYKPLFEGQVHHIFYLNEKLAKLYELKPDIVPDFKSMYELASSTPLVHEDIPERLGNGYDKIYMDGLEGRCFDLISKMEDAGKVTVVTFDPRVIKSCEEMGYSYLDKKMLGQ